MQNNFFLPQRGFSIIELIIAVAIIALLTLIAWPIWQESLLKNRRAQARSALHATMLQQEHYYTQHQTYRAFSSADHSSFKWWSGETPETSYYEISAEACPGKLLNQCVLLTAISGSDNVKKIDDPVCGNLMLDSVNHKSHSNNSKPNQLCW